MTLTIPSFLRNSFKNYGELPALTFVGEQPTTYRDLEQELMALIALFENQGVKPGDRVAILGANSPSWGKVYLAVTYMGALAVPMLPDFTKEEISNIIDHSGAVMIFVTDQLLSKIEGKEIIVASLERFHVKSPKETAYVPGAKPGKEYDVREEDAAAIIYTSGTTGTSKGVMLSHKNIVFTARGGGKVQPIDTSDRLLSILPMAHTYENTLGLILPLMKGASVHYLRKPPTAPVLLPALRQVKPTIMLSVPMIIEKIYRQKVLPSFEKKKVLKTLYRIPFFRRLLNRMAGKKLMETFGGSMRFFGVGGAKLDPTVEAFLIEARFPYAIGYGLTETSPLLAGVNPHNTRLESTGPAIEGVTVKINDPDPVTGEGEVWVKGPNVMMGYYKDPELTASVIDEEGWFRTGDLGILDKDNYLYIKGRIKNVIVGSSGKNIYPEEIEAIINNFKYVNESLVVDQKGKLTALIHFNMEELEARYQSIKEGLSSLFEQHVEEYLQEIQKKVNEKVNKFSRIQSAKSHSQPFQKTATQKIKRFLYQGDQPNSQNT